MRARANALAMQIHRWQRKYALSVLRDIQRGKIKVGKAAVDDFEAELRRLFERFGVEHLDDAGRRAAREAGGKWTLPREVVDEYLQGLDIKLTQISRNTREAVRNSVRVVLEEALRDDSRITAREIARRIARQYHGPTDAVPYKIGFERAELIARTELNDIDNTATFAGYAEAGVDEVDWQAYPDDGRSGDRRHWKMNDHKPRKMKDLQGSDTKKWFRLPSGLYTPRPGWQGLPVAERANCRCFLRPH